MGKIDWSIWLGLGRVSNLPTVWTNTIAGVVLAGGAINDLRVPLLLLAMSACYIAGMFLNDVFDREIDALERPERPIPSGLIETATVSTVAWGLFLFATILLLIVGFLFDSGSGWWPVVFGLLLVAAIVFYNVHHKDNPASPIVMGTCRMLVYLTSAFAITREPPLAVFVCAVLAVAYLIGLTYVAKQENLTEVRNLWPLACLGLPVAYGLSQVFDQNYTWVFLILLVAWIVITLSNLWRKPVGYIPKTVVGLIAGIALLDALFVATAGAPAIAVLCVIGFACTLLLQRWVSGT